jgi:putative hydrolase of the HAD superfamily
MTNAANSGPSERAVVFDGDDTLWDTQVLYDMAKNEFFQVLGDLGFARDVVATKFAEIDVGNVERLGLSRLRFPTSMRQTYEFLCEATGEGVRDDVSAHVARIAGRVFESTPVVRPDAVEALSLIGAYYRLVLFTAGDEEVQWMRVRQSGLQSRFDVVEVLPQKTSETWARLLRSKGLRASATWSIGNSVRSDINPALDLGLRCVLVSGGGWEFERALIAKGHVWRTAGLREAADIVLREDGLNGPRLGVNAMQAPRTDPLPP